MSSSRSPWSKRSLTAQAMGHVDPITKAVVPPIHVATTYIRDEDNAYSSGFVYGRPDNATIREAEDVLAMLEEAEAGALLFSSGMAAATAVFQALDPGRSHRRLQGHVLGPAQLADDGGRALGPQGRFRRDGRSRGPARGACSPGATKLVWVETPSNPLWTITDIAGAAEIAHAAGARLAVDSTTASPVHTRPLDARRRHRHACGDQGAERPFRRGGRRARRREGRRVLGRGSRRIRKMQGAILGPFEAYLLMRGMRTLHVRAAAQARSALTLARAPLRASQGRPRALSRPAAASRPRHRRPADGGRLRLHALDPGDRTARRPRSAPRRGSACGSARPRSAASRA